MGVTNIICIILQIIYHKIWIFTLVCADIFEYSSRTPDYQRNTGTGNRMQSINTEGVTENISLFHFPTVNIICTRIMIVWLSLLAFLIFHGQHYFEIILRANIIAQFQALSIGKVYSIKSLLLLSKCHLLWNRPANIDQESQAPQSTAKSERISLEGFRTFIAPVTTSLVLSDSLVSKS